MGSNAVSPASANAVAQAQVPAAGTLTVDHVAHFVPCIDEAARALERLGFALTPFSAQSHRLVPEGPLVPAGSGNRCAMLKRGYLEFLTPTGDTPIAAQLRAAIGRYAGVHLIAFGTADPDADRARLAAGGFAPLAPVALQRQIGTPDGEDTAHFTVVRVAPGTMAEGRIQFCRHHTPHLVWQPRWLEHRNRAEALTAAIVCVEHPADAAQRYARYTGVAARGLAAAWRIDTARGSLLLCDPATMVRNFGTLPPALPCIAGYVLASADIAAAERCLRDGGAAPQRLAGGRLSVTLPPSLGGVLAFEPIDAAPFDLQ